MIDSVKARRVRESALKKAIASVLSHDALEDEPDLYYGIDEIVEGDETLGYLADSVAQLEYADDTVPARYTADDPEPTDGVDRSVTRAKLRARDALDDYAEALVEEHIDEASEYIQGDVTLAELEARGEADD